MFWDIWSAAGYCLVAFWSLSGCFLVVCSLLWLLRSYECCLLWYMLWNMLRNMLCIVCGIFGQLLVAFWLFALCCGCSAPTNALCCGICSGICCGIYIGIFCGVFGQLLFAVCLLSGRFLVIFSWLWLLRSYECSLLGQMLWNMCWNMWWNSLWDI